MGMLALIKMGVYNNHSVYHMNVTKQSNTS